MAKHGQYGAWRKAGLVALTLGLAASVSAQDFQWSWEQPENDDAPSAPEAPVSAEPMSETPETLPSGVDPATYNRLLKENLDLRRKLQDSDRGAEAVREENLKLRRELVDLEERITESVRQIEQLRGDRTREADPEKVINLETRLMAAESERERLARDIEVLRDRLERTDGTPPAAPAPGPQIKPGADLFVALEEENADLRRRVAAIEAEKQKVTRQLREAEAEAEAKGELVGEIAKVETETEKHRQVIRGLLEKIPRLESELAEARSNVQEKDAVLTGKERELQALRQELEQREARLEKVERVAVLLARTQTEVRQVGDSRQRDMHFNMAVMFANRGKYKEAEKEYLRALRLDPNDADTHFNLGILYEENLKRPGKAARHYRRYLKLRPNAPDAAEVRLWIAACDVR